MESTEKLVQTWMASSREEELNSIISDITCDRTSLINVVKALGEYLTSEDADILRKGVELLSLVVERSPKEKLNTQSVRVLTTFFHGKLEDSITFKDSLIGISVLASQPNLPASEARIVMEKLFRFTNMKTLVQDVRFKVFSIIDSFMACHREVLKTMGKAFLDGYINLAEGEKDPRNLMVAFAIARVILIEFDIGDHVESIFNILFCYFPITFRPPPNDRYGISSEGLRSALRDCLNATPTFGPLAIPVFLDKIASGSRTTKRDSLQTLAFCLPVYGSALARASARKLWNSLKLEIFQPVDPETEEEALQAVQVLIKTIYADEEVGVESNEDIQGLARDACEECIQILKEPEKSRARPANKILCAFVLTTTSVRRYTISIVVPHLVKLFHDPDEILARFSTLALLCELIATTKDISHNTDIPLTPYKDDILGVLTVSLKVVELRDVALSGLKSMASSNSLLSDEELGFIVHNVTPVITEDVPNDTDASSSALELLSIISEMSPYHVIEQTLPRLFSRLPDVAPPRDSASEREECWRVLNALQELCIQQELFEILVIRLTTKLDLICFPSAGRLPLISSDIEPTAAYCHMIMKTLAQALTIKVKRKHPDVAKYIDRLVPCIFNIFVCSAFFSDSRTIIIMDPRLLTVAGDIITLVVLSLPLQRQQSYANALSKALVDGDTVLIAQGIQKTKITTVPIFGLAPTPSAQKNLVALFSAAAIPLRKEVRLSLGDVGEFLDMLLLWVLERAETDLQKLSALHIVASILNRQASELSSFLRDKLDVYWSKEISDRSSTLPRRIWAVRSWKWMTRALVVVKHELAVTFAERLFEIFSDDAVGWEAGKAVGEIPSSDAILTKANHADVKILHVQKYVAVVLPYIIALSKDSSDPVRQTSSLVALTTLIKSIPRAAYASEMATLITLLLRALDLPDPEIRRNVIDTLHASAEGATLEENYISEHSVTLVNCMLKNCKVDGMQSPSVRISALRYLATLPNIVRYEVLHHYKPIVLKELASVLDDPKRSVRREAVTARTNWFKYKG